MRIGRNSQFQEKIQINSHKTYFTFTRNNNNEKI